jgi:hypothetical protein
MLRSNSRLRERLDPIGVELLTHIAGSVERILPYVEPVKWTEGKWTEPGTAWHGSGRTTIRITISIGNSDTPGNRSLTALVRRRKSLDRRTGLTLDAREHDLCARIAARITEIMSYVFIDEELELETSESTIRAFRDSFDESVIAVNIEKYHNLNMSIVALLSALHTMSEQTYENKALVFGCLLDPEYRSVGDSPHFPELFLNAKKYKVLSDGYRTAYHVAGDGGVIDFVDLDRLKAPALTKKYYFPEWAKAMARVSRAGKCGIALTRLGDILVFDEGALCLTYRYGRWRYWNHAYVVNLLRDRARAQRVPTEILGNVVGGIYRVALDISFRKTGGLFVILHNRRDIHEIVRLGDAIDDSNRNRTDSDFDIIVRAHKIQSLPRIVAAELASLDGATVLANSGEILAYGSVLQPKKRGNIRLFEGSRTKAAVGASNYGLAIKISSDGDITVYHEGRVFFVI